MGLFVGKDAQKCASNSQRLKIHVTIVVEVVFNMDLQLLILTSIATICPNIFIIQLLKTDSKNDSSKIALQLTLIENLDIIEVVIRIQFQNDQ